MHQISKSEDIIEYNDKKVTFKYLFEKCKLLELKINFLSKYIETMNNKETIVIKEDKKQENIIPDCVTICKKQNHKHYQYGGAFGNEISDLELAKKLEEAINKKSNDHIELYNSKLNDRQIDLLYDRGYDIIDLTSSIAKIIDPLLNCFGAMVQRKTGVYFK